MEHKYTQLKWKLLLLVAGGVLAALLLGWAVLELLVDGLWQDPFARLFVWVVENLFGQEEAYALELYDTYVRGPKHIYILAAVVVMMLGAFYLALGRVTRWLDRIGAALDRVAQEDGGEVELPDELSPIRESLSGLQSTLRARQEEQRQEEGRKNDLLVFLAHDLKTPLTSVIGYLTLLRSDPDLSPEQRSKYTGIALDKALRLEDLLLEFFDITRESLHREAAPTVDIQLSMLLEQLADEFFPQFQEKGLTCRTRIQPRLAVRGEADKLARVFDNVLRNAVSYSEAGGAVELEAERREGRVVITIRNQGLGIPEGELARIFQKFYRLDSARSTRTGGAGLGLAIAKEIVEAHGGAIRAESDGQKTAFVIDLPAI